MSEELRGSYGRLQHWKDTCFCRRGQLRVEASRVLNDFLKLGFNEDETGRRVFDGILSHTGGGSGDQINYRFAQTDRTERNRQNHLYPESVFPFAHQVLTDHLSGKTGGRSERCKESHTCPKRFGVNTANEYWCKACSLLHTDTQGNDLPDPENVRFYLLSGLSHGVGDITDRKKDQQFTNGVTPYAAHRTAPRHRRPQSTSHGNDRSCQREFS